MKYIYLCVVLSLTCLGGEAVLNIRKELNGDVIMHISGGTNNVQYQIFTTPDNNVVSTNWYYWRRAYPNTEILVTSTNTPWRTQGIYQIRGVLPD